MRVMRSLFFKIFLWFWVSLILVGIALVLTTLSTGSDVETLRWRSAALAISAQNAVEVFERGGREGLRSYLQRVEMRTRLRSYLFDASGIELSGRPEPPGAQSLALRALNSSETEFDLSGAVPLGARKETTRAGTDFVLVAELPVRPVPLRGDPRGRPPPLRGRPQEVPFLSFLRGEPSSLALRLLVVFLTGGGVCYGLARYIASPVSRLRAATRLLSGGDLSVRVGASLGSRRDELGDLSRDFDGMAERLENLLESQRRLLGDISHELRSPLARMSVALELARRSSGPESAWALDRIAREAERLNEMVAQLLTLTRLESGLSGIEKCELGLGDLLREVVEDAAFEAQGGNRRVTLSVDEDFRLTGNEGLVRSAFENVIRNAVAYTDPDTEVEVRLFGEPGPGGREAVTTVRDHGRGVPESALSGMFRPFYRVEDARDRQSGGSGLGLSIAERCIHHHGGRIQAANAHGGGLLVTIRFPASPFLKSAPGGELPASDQTPGQ